jgi:SET domain-containing protein
MHEFIEIKEISKDKGRGAFAKKDIEKKTIIDIAPIILIPNNEYSKIKKTVLYDYCYIWDDPKHKPEFKNAITLSISQFINHSYKPNVKYLYDYKKKAIEFVSIKNIKQGDELTMNYNGRANDKSPVWFNVIE